MSSFILFVQSNWKILKDKDNMVLEYRKIEIFRILIINRYLYISSSYKYVYK